MRWLSTGWLSPEGKLYPCSHWQHFEAAEEIYQSFGYSNDSVLPEDDQLIELYGWIKISYSIFENSYTLFYSDLLASKEQKTYLKQHYELQPEDWGEFGRFALYDLDIISREEWEGAK